MSTPTRQRTCPECGYGSGGHHQNCPERPDEPEDDVIEVEYQPDDDAPALPFPHG